MLGINYWAVVASAVVMFVGGGLWYSPLLFGNLWLELRGIDPATVANATPPIWELLGEFIRGLIIAFVFARFLWLLKITDVKGALDVGLWLWFGFYAAILLGSVLHENYPLTLFAIHAGHGLANFLLMAVIIGAWPTRSKSAQISG